MAKCKKNVTLELRFSWQAKVRACFLACCHHLNRCRPASEQLQRSIIKISLKISELKFLSDFLGANELVLMFINFVQKTFDQNALKRKCHFDEIL